MSNHLLNNFIDVQFGSGPIVAVAIHDGHAIRDEVSPLLVISEENRRREEDANSSEWTRIAPTRVVGLRSRFEVDLNRPRDRAVYRSADDAWGLDVWKQPPEDELVERSLELYDAFYERMHQILSEIQQRHGWFFVYDFHCYNHRRDGALAEPSPAIDNPQINLCTGGMDLERCEPLVRCFEDAIGEFDFPIGTLDVRRNVRFRATRFSRWVHENFPGTGTSLGIEVKKFFMNEWTGEVDQDLVTAIGNAFETTVQPIRHTLMSLQSSSMA